MTGPTDVRYVAAMLRHVCEAMIAATDVLTDADLHVGDGDHGIGMRRGFEGTLVDLDATPPDSVEAAFKVMGGARPSRGPISPISSRLVLRRCRSAAAPPKVRRRSSTVRRRPPAPRRGHKGDGGHRRQGAVARRKEHRFPRSGGAVALAHSEGNAGILGTRLSPSGRTKRQRVPARASLAHAIRHYLHAWHGFAHDHPARPGRFHATVPRAGIEPFHPPSIPRRTAFHVRLACRPSS